MGAYRAKSQEWAAWESPPQVDTIARHSRGRQRGASEKACNPWVGTTGSDDLGPSICPRIAGFGWGEINTQRGRGRTLKGSSSSPHRPDGTTVEPSTAAYLGRHFGVTHEEAHHCTYKGRGKLGDRHCSLPIQALWAAVVQGRHMPRHPRGGWRCVDRKGENHKPLPGPHVSEHRIPCLWVYPAPPEDRKRNLWTLRFQPAESKAWERGHWSRAS